MCYSADLSQPLQTSACDTRGGVRKVDFAACAFCCYNWLLRCGQWREVFRLSPLVQCLIFVQCLIPLPDCVCWQCPPGTLAHVFQVVKQVVLQTDANRSTATFSQRLTTLQVASHMLSVLSCLAHASCVRSGTGCTAAVLSVPSRVCCMGHSELSW